MTNRNAQVVQPPHVPMQAYATRMVRAHVYTDGGDLHALAHVQVCIGEFIFNQLIC
jgi:hypothetical protein